MNKNFILLLLAVFLTQYATAQYYLENKEQINNHADSIMYYLQEEDFSKAFSSLSDYWPLPESEIMQLESHTIKQMNLVSDRFGDVIGFEFVKEENIKDYVIKKSYVLRYNFHMLEFNFIYYKNENGWILNSFKWSDEFDDLFE